MPESIDAPTTDEADDAATEGPSDAHDDQGEATEEPAESNIEEWQQLPVELALDDDSDTSMVTSLLLHLVSEHDVWSGASMRMREADALHRNLHEHPVDEDDAWGHDEDDIQFRPGRALAGIAARYANPDNGEGMLHVAGTPPTPPA